MENVKKQIRILSINNKNILTFDLYGDIVTSKIRIYDSDKRQEHVTEGLWKKRKRI